MKSSQKNWAVPLSMGMLLGIVSSAVFSLQVSLYASVIDLSDALKSQQATIGELSNITLPSDPKFGMRTTEDISVEMLVGLGHETNTFSRANELAYTYQDDSRGEGRNNITYLMHVTNNTDTDQQVVLTSIFDSYLQNTSLTWPGSSSHRYESEHLDYLRSHYPINSSEESRREHNERIAEYQRQLSIRTVDNTCWLSDNPRSQNYTETGAISTPNTYVPCFWDTVDNGGASFGHGRLSPIAQISARSGDESLDYSHEISIPAQRTFNIRFTGFRIGSPHNQNICSLTFVDSGNLSANESQVCMRPDLQNFSTSIYLDTNQLINLLLGRNEQTPVVSPLTPIVEQKAFAEPTPSIKQDKARNQKFEVDSESSAELLKDSNNKSFELPADLFNIEY